MGHHPGRTAAQAFAEGRRLRADAERRISRAAERRISRAAERRISRAAERRAHRQARRHPHHGGALRARRGPPVVLVLLLLPLLGSAVVATVLAAVSVITVVLVYAVPALVVGGVAFHAVRRHRRQALRRSAAGTAPLPGRPAAPKRPAVVWAGARERFGRVAAAYAAHECDAMAVLRLPALSDVTVASTGRFVDAFAEAQALDSDAFPGEEHAAAFVRAVDRAERAWRAARESAERIRLSGLTPAERTSVERAIKLLTVARDSGNEAERLAAYARARTELDRLDAAGVVHLPRSARAALDASARGALPA